MKVMRNIFFQIETEESVDKDYVLVFVNNDSNIKAAKTIIEALYCVEKANIADAVKTSAHKIFKAIYVYPKKDVSTEDIKCLLDEISASDGVVSDIINAFLMQREEVLIRQKDILNDYGRVIMKMAKCDKKNIINDMCLIWKKLVCDATGIAIDSSDKKMVESIGQLPNKEHVAELYRDVIIDYLNKDDDSFNMKVTRIFNATNAFIFEMFKSVQLSNL